MDKYALYQEAVQSPDVDAHLLRKVYRELRKREPHLLREDFCGTFSICAEWAKLDKANRAFGLDMDPEPLAYGHEQMSRMKVSPKQKVSLQKRVRILEMNVLDPKGPRADITAALNFSYFVFKTREQLRKYFVSSLRALRPQGLLVLDIFGGPACCEANEEHTKYRKFTYYWDQRSYDSITNRAKFSIHFKPKGGKKIENVFTYDWRMWSIPEIRDLLAEAGFKKSHVYWEGDDKKGGGNGVYTRTEIGEECLAWVAYIVAEK